jgi:peptide/nickel transport system permease protein
MFFVLWLVASMSFFGALSLGDPAQVLAGPHASQRDRAYIRRYYHLDQPKMVQYGYYLSHVVRGDLGQSFRYHRPVSELIGERMPRTLLLGFMTLVIEFGLGVIVGTWSAARRGTRREALVLGATFLGMSMPSFISGKVCLLVLAYWLGLFPIGGYGTSTLDTLYHGLLPAMVLGLLGTSIEARLVRNELIEVLQSDYVRTARAKGVGEFSVVVRHALRNALMPVVTSLGLSFGALFSGAIITEQIFAWPGLGRLAFESIAGFDLPVIMGTVLTASTGILLGSFVSDLAYSFLDPRIRRK